MSNSLDRASGRGPIGPPAREDQGGGTKIQRPGLTRHAKVSTRVRVHPCALWRWNRRSKPTQLLWQMGAGSGISAFGNRTPCSECSAGGQDRERPWSSSIHYRGTPVRGPGAIAVHRLHRRAGRRRGRRRWCHTAPGESIGAMGRSGSSIREDGAHRIRRGRTTNDGGVETRRSGPIGHHH